MRSLLTGLFVCCFTFSALSQDVHLTQYYTSNLFLNPTYTGNYDGDIRVVANARSQWGQVSTPIKSNLISFEKKILKFPDEFAIGMIVVNDQVSAYHYNTNKALISGSYQKDINKNLIRVGLQVGVVFRSIDLGGLSFPGQWDYSSGFFDPSVPNGEMNLQNSYKYFDLNAGLGWTRRFNKTELTAGYGIFHLNHPSDGFVVKNNGLPFRHTFNVMAHYNLSPQTTIIPHLLFMRTAKATDFILGTNACKMVNKNTGFLLGAGYRGSQTNSDALLAIAGFNYKRFQFGFSMDFNVSQLSKDARNKSAWEISISYTTPARVADKVTIPCDRY